MDAAADKQKLADARRPRPHDLEGDGKLEVMERDLSTTILRKHDGRELCSDVVPFCDRGC